MMQNVSKTPLILDLVERTVHGAFFGFMCWTFLRAWFETGSVVSLILLVSEGSVVAFMIVRRFTTDVSVRYGDWMLAAAGTLLPLIVRPVGYELLPVSICAPLMLAGIAIQIAAKFTLRRSMGVVPANRGVKIGGPYRIIRHPMYAGYLVTHIGFLLSNLSIWNAAVYALGLAFQIGRIRAEERLLGGHADYRAFADTVRFRLVPHVF